MKVSEYFKSQGPNVIDSGKDFNKFFGEMEVVPSNGPVYFKDLGLEHDIQGVLEKFHPGEVSLGEIAHLILKEDKLVRDFKFNVFYVKDAEDILRIVDVYHDSSGWYICSRALNDTRKCIVSRLFSSTPFK
jgi:hypothetical protein